MVQVVVMAFFRTEVLVADLGSLAVREVALPPRPFPQLFLSCPADGSTPLLIYYGTWLQCDTFYSVLGLD